MFVPRPAASRLRRSLAPLGAVALAVLMGCSKKDGTSPGSGTTGPTFDVVFPATSPGSSQRVQFTDVGTWNYHCNVHPSMTGTVVVDGASLVESLTVQVSTPAPGNGLLFNPSSVTIKQNGFVRWTNVSTLPHTVTRP